MQNEFEKQVREKMKELNLVPSAPVWDRVEEQIRRKKDRRRAIIWLPMLGLLLAGGIWWLNDAGNQTTFSGTKNAPAKLPSAHSTNDEKQLTTKQPTVNNFSDQQSEPDKLLNETRNGSSLSGSILPGSGASSTSNDEFKNQKSHTNPTAHLKKTKQFDNVNAVPQNFNALQEPSATSDNNVTALNNERVDIFRFQPDRNIEPQNEKATKYIIAPKDQFSPPVEYKPVVKTSSEPRVVIRGTIKQERAWEFGVAGSAGVSGSKSGLNFLGGNKSMDAAFMAQSVQPPFANSNNSSAPQTIKNNFAFSVGVAARKPLGKRFAISTGILYEYLSTISNVGIRINQASAVQNNLNGSFYYASYSTSQQEYLNQYHFISVPVAIHYQVLKRTPLSVNAGISVKRLIRTNALEFNHSSQLYYYNRNAFNRTQLFPTFGLEYALLKDQALVIGPQVEGSLVALKKDGSDEHLFMGSLQVKWFFLKN